MKTNHRPNPSKEMIDTAVEWLLEQQEGFAPGRAAQFQAWRQADPRHACAVDKAQRTLAMLSELPELEEALAHRLGEEPAPEAQVAPARRWGRTLVWTAAAAAAVAVATMSILQWRVPAADNTEFNYVSNADRPQQVVLNDGSFIDLNSRTTIRTQLLPHERRIALQEGEAHFAVAHDPSRPFIVEVGGVSVRAVGTAFNIRLNQDRVEVLVLEGKVEIAETRPGTNAPAAARPQLGVGDRARISRATIAPTLLVEKANQDELRDALSWHSQVTTVSSRPLREIVELFNRRNKLRLVIDDPELAGRNLGGSFALDQPHTLIRALEIDGDVVSEPRGADEIVLRRKR
jgi:transmembrane sensor